MTDQHLVEYLARMDCRGDLGSRRRDRKAAEGTGGV